MKICVYGKNLEAAPGRYLELNETWADGAVVELSLPMELRAVPAPGAPNFLAWVRGPLLLARDSRLGPLNLPVSPSVRGHATDVPPARPGFLHLQKVKGETLCDFASAGNLFKPSNTLRVWLPRKPR